MQYVVSDIHGEISKLKQLFNYIKLLDKHPEFIFIGDYIDKGEDAKATLDYLVQISNDYRCTFLLGNHEYCWINAPSFEEYLIKYGGKNTIKAFGAKNVSEVQKILINEYQPFFDSLTNYYITDSYFIAHSGVSPADYLILDIKDIKQESFLFNRYSFIKQESLFQNRYKVIFGHTGFYKPYIDNYKIGIDTAACYLPDQPITCFCTDTDFFFNSNKENYSLESLTGKFCPNIVRNKPFRLDD